MSRSSSGRGFSRARLRLEDTLYIRENGEDINETKGNQPMVDLWQPTMFLSCSPDDSLADPTIFRVIERHPFWVKACKPCAYKLRTRGVPGAIIYTSIKKWRCTIPTMVGRSDDCACKLLVLHHADGMHQVVPRGKVSAHVLAGACLYCARPTSGGVAIFLEMTRQ